MNRQQNPKRVPLGKVPLGWVPLGGVALGWVALGRVALGWGMHWWVAPDGVALAERGMGGGARLGDV